MHGGIDIIALGEKRLTSPASLENYPSRIVCLTEETTETLYLLGEQERIVAVSGYTVRPPEARSKPRVSSFKNARYDSILDLEPDLILTFSDVQADIAAELIRRGQTVLNFNQRSIAEIYEMIFTLAKLVGKPAEGLALIKSFQKGLDQIKDQASQFAFRPVVFFEEWKDPLINGIQWVEELIKIAGGEPAFPERQGSKAENRVVSPAEVVERNPDVILASWCGMKVNFDTIRNRPNWSQIKAVQTNRLYEIKSAHILQPGPAALTDGVQQIHQILGSIAEGCARQD